MLHLRIMRFRRDWKVDIVALLGVGSIIVYNCQSDNGIRQDVVIRQDNAMDGVSAGELAETLMLQRNELSRRYNEMSQKAAMLSCEIETLTKPSQKESFVSMSGGWCEKHLSDKEFQSRAAYDLTYAISVFLAGKKVGSFGDGPGTYKMIFDKYNKVASYDAYDGGPYYNITSNGRVKYLDLTAPQYGLPLYDWVVSLEVAEHIDAKFEAIYLSNVVRHALEGVIISWAAPGQRGIRHINCKPFTYVMSEMDKLGFKFSHKESLKLRYSTQNIVYKKSLSIFRRKSTVPVVLDML